MKLRKLPVSEHIRTAKLWREAFSEDTKSFVDYYYSVKVAENEVYVLEHEGEIISMVHLNPYRMRVKGEIYDTHYIVGVATDVRYRGKGYMRKVLEYALFVMKERGEPFTYLMPASEAIYEPFGFERVYSVNKREIIGRPLKCQGIFAVPVSDTGSCRAAENEGDVLFTEATAGDFDAMADFANERLKEFDVVTVRDGKYYADLSLQKGSEGGGILLAKIDGKIAGIFPYVPIGDEARMEIREPLCADEGLLYHAVYLLAGESKASASCVISAPSFRGADAGDAFGRARDTDSVIRQSHIGVSRGEVGEAVDEKERGEGEYMSRGPAQTIMAKKLNDDFDFNLRELKVFINEEV